MKQGSCRLPFRHSWIKDPLWAGRESRDGFPLTCKICHRWERDSEILQPSASNSSPARGLATSVPHINQPGSVGAGCSLYTSPARATSSTNSCRALQLLPLCVTPLVPPLVPPLERDLQLFPANTRHGKGSFILSLVSSSRDTAVQPGETLPEGSAKPPARRGGAGGGLPASAPAGGGRRRRRCRAPAPSAGAAASAGLLPGAAAAGAR